MDYRALMTYATNRLNLAKTPPLIASAPMNNALQINASNPLEGANSPVVQY
jgi:hypothetical protein